MNKIKLIIFVFVFIVIFCVVGSFFIQADTEIKGEEDILTLQNEITGNINIYGYTIDNPNVIVNPYGENYNTALIAFETKDYVSIKVNVNDVYTYESNITNKHYIGVYNLVEGLNYVTLTYDDIVKKIELNVEKGNEIKSGDMIMLSNNHFIIPTYKYISDNVYTGFREIDVFGKIYYEYLLEDGYYGIACEMDDEYIIVLSEDLVIIDRQNGEIRKYIDIAKYDDNWLYMEYIEKNIIIYGEESKISVSLTGDISLYDGEYEKDYLSGDINYMKKDSVRFYKDLMTETSDENIWLLSYDKDIPYDIKIEKDFNRIIVNSKDINDCNNYIILDKLFDRKIYKLCDNITYIYTYDFSGKYSIYYKLDDNLYKSNNYLKF